MTLRRLRHAILAAALFSAGPALAEEAGKAADPHAGHSMSPMAAETPAACKAAEPKADAAGGMAPGMAMQGSMSGDLSPVQAANMAAMEVMHGPMTAAAAIEDADLAFNCGMIAHHRGAIAMAKVELEHGKDTASRTLAEKIIAAQETEIAEMTAWVEAHAK
ncbi:MULTISPECIES: DUF305 domain-containing protein [unclassified Aureimonas]|uniref:CopM family metallochaperone n=1 Tax=unclassified Aureimonas TaxID=2615206 RepID=UPI0006F6199D|nr:MULTISPECIES: DUF305 domain-containing protein [unclassified Aureimonas]KQT52773.1 hypothetical protein ASG62_12640 [Aureimonas sp. Leaf427]KQT80232.1 hypothetical protein ASG54_06490 [Aureimonas sp. Leaf460]